MKRKNPPDVDPMYWINFVLNALSGHNPDAYYKEHHEEIDAVAHWLWEKFKTPPDRVLGYRGLMVSPEMAKSPEIAAYEHTAYVSFSENPEIAYLFADMKHPISRYFAVKHPNYIGVICSANIPKDEVLFHWEWFFKTPLVKMKPEWGNIVQEQKEIIVKNIKRPIKVDLIIRPGETMRVWPKYPFTYHTT